jgi:transcriptional antiterminator RfaH
MMNWYAIYTKPKAEDSTALLLSSAGIETFNPKIRVKKYIRKKYVSVIEHLFPCYIFAFLDSGKHIHMITYTRGVKYIVGKESPLVVFPEIIEAIRERMDGEFVRPSPLRLKKGDRVLVKEGPFKDFYGIFERNISGKERVMILLETLHCKLDIESLSLDKI